MLLTTREEYCCVVGRPRHWRWREVIKREFAAQREEKRAQQLLRSDKLHHLGHGITFKAYKQKNQ